MGAIALLPFLKIYKQYALFKAYMGGEHGFLKTAQCAVLPCEVSLHIRGASGARVGRCPYCQRDICNLFKFTLFKAYMGGNLNNLVVNTVFRQLFI